MLHLYLDFEKPIADLEARLEELRVDRHPDHKKVAEIAKVEKKLDQARAGIYGNLTAWQRTLIARHQHRPYFLDYTTLILTDFMELHGDRLYGDDPAIVAGLATLEGRSVVAMGHQKGRNVKENMYRNFGMPNPEGYRKALRVMRLAEKFGKPVLTFIDTPGAYPGLGAEERGQAEAIARAIYEMARLRVPTVSVVIGEGGAAAPWPSAWPTGSSCSRTRSTRSSRPRRARPSCGGTTRARYPTRRPPCDSTPPMPWRSA